MLSVLHLGCIRGYKFLNFFCRFFPSYVDFLNGSFKFLAIFSHLCFVLYWENLSNLSSKQSITHFVCFFFFFLIAPSFHCVPSYVFESNPNFCNYTLFPALCLIFWVPFLLFICWHVTFVVFRARDFLHTVHHIWERGTKKIVENSVWLTGAFDWWVSWGKIGGKNLTVGLSDSQMSGSLGISSLASLFLREDREKSSCFLWLPLYRFALIFKFSPPLINSKFPILCW